MVSFQPSEEQQLIRDTIASFAHEQIRPHARDADENGAVPAAIVQQGWELGLVQSSIPEAHGGHGDTRSAVTGALIAEELAWGDLAVAMHLLTPRLAVWPVLMLGSAEQQTSVLGAYTGNSFRTGTAAVMEPRFDFDATEPATTAHRSNGGYVLDGTKCYVPLADQADRIVVTARTDGGGVGAFIVDRDTPGLTIGEREQHMGIKALATYTLTLESCRVPAAHRLGGDDANVLALANHWRVGLAAMAVGVARAAFEYARDYARERHAFGMAIARKQAIAFMLAEMAIEIDAARLLAWEAAWRIDRGLDATREAYLAKNYAANVALKVTDNAVQILGGHGYIREHPVEMWLRNGRGFVTFEGLVML
ncbi:acyl-CoA dehydrogenase family protein [Candidatus Binatia bacterium]|nr:acyl-CoA dehydrogenase family protein [Candidatus Binatia bacterium]